MTGKRAKEEKTPIQLPEPDDNDRAVLREYGRGMTLDQLIARTRAKAENRPAAKFTRRKMLKAISAASLVAPFALNYDVRKAQAQSEPDNLLIVTWPIGLEPPWEPSGSGTSYSFSTPIRALEPFRAKLVIPIGIRMGYGNVILAHNEGALSLYTGSTNFLIPTSLATSPSIDQIIANRIGSATPYKSLHAGVYANWNSFFAEPYMHYAGREQPVPAEDDPNVLYRILADAVATSAGDPNAERIVRKKASVLDYLKGELNRVRGVVASSDREKVDQHEEAVRGLERALMGTMGGAGAGCGVPAQPGLTKQQALESANFTRVTEIQTDLLALALQCGLTKVVTLQLSNTDSQLKPPGMSHNRAVHEAGHDGNTQERMECQTYFMQRLGAILQRLESTDMGNGQTLLDKTLVVMGTEMSVPGHGDVPTPLFIAGGSKPFFRYGECVRMTDRPIHTRPMLSVLHYYGFTEMQTLGEMSMTNSSGPLTAIHR